MFLEETIKEEYKKWGDEEPSTILVKAPTGSGKTWFILNKLFPYAKEHGKTVKIYVSRLTLQSMYQDWREEYAVENACDVIKIGKEVIIDTYQALEERIRLGKVEEKVDYLVFDECHYFLTDSLFNSETVLSFEYALNQNNANVRIFMSATGERVFNKIIKENQLVNCKAEQSEGCMHVRIPRKEYIEYTVNKPKTYEVHYYDDKVSRVDVIKSDLEGKWLVYVTNQAVGEKLRDELIQNDVFATFLCRKNRGEEAETFNSVSTLERFEARVLITTAVVETGINFRDDVTNIMIESNYEEQFLQMLGRRRFKERQSIRLYIPYRSERYFRRLYEECCKEIEEARIILRYGVNRLPELICKGRIDFNVASKMLYEKGGSIYLNVLTLEELIHCRTVLQKRIDNIEKDESAFIKEQLSWLEMKDSYSETYSFREHIRQSALSTLKERVMKCFVEKKTMNNQDKMKWLKELVPIVKIIDKEYIKKDGFSEGSFNDLCKRFSLGFYMTKSSKNSDRRTYYWIEELQQETAKPVPVAKE